MVIEFKEQDSVVFDEIMAVMKRCPNLEKLHLEDEKAAFFPPGLEICPERRKIYSNSHEISMSVQLTEQGRKLTAKVDR